MNGQAIIISASGMCEAGRILHHLANNIGNPKNTVLFVGYCAEHTLGRKIMDGWKEVPILGKQYTVGARIREMDSFSGHADHGELLEYFDKTGGPKRNIIAPGARGRSGRKLSAGLWRVRHFCGGCSACSISHGRMAGSPMPSLFIEYPTDAESQMGSVSMTTHLCRTTEEELGPGLKSVPARPAWKDRLPGMSWRTRWLRLHAFKRPIHQREDLQGTLIPFLHQGGCPLENFG